MEAGGLDLSQSGYNYQGGGAVRGTENNEQRFALEKLKHPFWTERTGEIIKIQEKV